MSAYRISVVIPTYQRCDSVQRLLLSLARQTLASEVYEVIVVIDGSHDGTSEMLERQVKAGSFPYCCRAIWQTNGGRAAACNTGIRAAMGELVVLLDDDMEAAPGLLDGHWQAHHQAIQKRADERTDERVCGVLGAVPIRYTPSAPPVVQYIGAKFNSHLTKLARPDYQIGFRDFYSGNFSIPRVRLLEVGLFDESFTIYGNEDGELAVRLMAAGVELVYCGDALATQHYEKTFASLARDHIAIGKTAVQCAQKHPETFSALRLGAYQYYGWKWRTLLGGLLGLNRVFARLPDWVTRFIGWLEKRHPAHLPLYYNFTLDYFFWLGVRSAQSSVGRVPSATGKRGELAA